MKLLTKSIMSFLQMLETRKQQTPSFLRRQKPYKIYWVLLIKLITVQALGNTEIKDFLKVHFKEVPKPQRLWIDKQMQKDIKKRFNPSQIKLSYRYWKQDKKTIWILDEIGKERNITTGIVVENNKIQNVQVLVYRESRGGQVQAQRFTSQYQNKDSQSNFTKEIDSISGATLSVNALNKQVQLALFLNTFLKINE